MNTTWKGHKRPHLLDYKFAYGHIKTRLERWTYDEWDVRDNAICTRYSYIGVLEPETRNIIYVYHKNRPNIRYTKKHDGYLWDLIDIDG